MAVSELDVALQHELERMSLRMGVQKFRKKELVEFQQDLLQDYFEPLAKAIECRQSEIGAERTKAGVADFALLALGSEELALVTLIGVLHSIAASKRDLDVRGRRAEASVRSTAMRIGEHCRNEFIRNFGNKVSDEPELANAVSAETESHQESDNEPDDKFAGILRITNLLLSRQENVYNARSRTKKLIDTMKSDAWWDDKRQIALGVELIGIACEVTKLFEFAHQSLGHSRDKRTKIIKLTDAGNAWLAGIIDKRVSSLHHSGSIALPMNLPMIVVPKNWGGTKYGGYLLTPMSLVKSNHENFVKEDTYDFDDMPEVVESVNTLQRTSWRVNARLFEKYKEYWHKRDACPTLFSAAGENKVRPEQFAAISVRIDHCNAFLRKRMYFPYQLDFRGRAYAVPQILNAQSDDGTRALLEFGSPCAVTDDSEYWTAIHAANSFGLDKLSFGARYRWMNEQRSAIAKFVNDPLSELAFWKGADEPWSFLAACMEWTSILSGSTETYLPAYVDGRCNGLQHLSAISRDEVAGIGVNLIPNEVPQDLYTEIANRLLELLKLDGSKEAQYWIGKVDRKTVKRPVMTTPYGVTPEGILEQLKEATSQYRNRPLVLLRDELLKTIEDTMHGPTLVKEWLQQTARQVASHGHAISWQTPVGFPVVQNYRRPIYRRLNASRFTVRYYMPVTGNHPANKKQQVDSIVANYTHSMDAAHLVRVVNRLRREGVSNIGVVHDSFGVHAAHVPLMNKVIREEFVNIYRENVLYKFFEQISESTRVPLVPFKQYGKLDIESVLHSKYFFA